METNEETAAMVRRRASMRVGFVEVVGPLSRERSAAHKCADERLYYERKARPLAEQYPRVSTHDPDTR
jgi:hypothetical protein